MFAGMKWKKEMQNGFVLNADLYVRVVNLKELV